MASRRDFPRAWWTVSVAYAVSWFIDQAARQNNGGLEAAHVLIGVQLVIFAIVVIPKVRDLLVVSFWIAVLATVASQMDLLDTHRMAFVSVLSTPVLLPHLWKWKHELRPAVVVYVIIAGVLSGWMVQYFPEPRDTFNLWFWWAYTPARLLSFGLFMRAAYRWRTVAEPWPDRA